jgi:hypothetical protein
VCTAVVNVLHDDGPVRSRTGRILMLFTHYYELNDNCLHSLVEVVEICVKQHCCWSTHANAVTSCSWYQTDDRGLGLLEVSPTQPPIQCVMGAILPRLKRPWRETDHSPPSRADFNYVCVVIDPLPTHLYGLLLN